jgi:lysine-N-methylase
MNHYSIVPKYYKSFNCIGSECEDTCCSGWRVPVDSNTLNKYKKVSDKELKPLLQNVKNLLEIDSCGNCVFLSEQKLCKIQLKLGESFLSDTCFLYPRNFNQFNNTIEASAHVSCPEIARLVLLDLEAMKFENNTSEIETRGKIQYYNKNLNLEEIKKITLNILQNRENKLSERLLILGIFLQEGQSVQQNYISSGKEIFTEFPPMIEMQIDFLNTFLDLIGDGGKGNERYKECALNALQWLNLSKDIKIASNNYKNAYENYYIPFMNQYEYSLENYLVNYLYSRGFPYNSTNIYDEYILLIVFYSLIKFFLICLSGSNKGLDSNLLVMLIQSFAKRFEHNHSTTKIIEIMKNVGFIELTHMMILIKN